MSGLGQDVHYVLRMLRRSPGFTIVAVASLAIAVGSNTAIFGVVRTLLLTPLAVERPLVKHLRQRDFPGYLVERAPVSRARRQSPGDTDIRFALFFKVRSVQRGYSAGD